MQLQPKSLLESVPFRDMPISVHPEDAVKYGLKYAALYARLKEAIHLILESIPERVIELDGKTWVKITVKDACEVTPWVQYRVMINYIKKLEELGLIESVTMLDQFGQPRYIRLP